MADKIKRRKFISYCTLAAAAVIMPPVFQSCSKKTNSDLQPAEFLKLSALLTGFKVTELDSSLAPVYLQSLKDFPPADVTAAELYSALNLDSDKMPGTKIIEQTVYGDPQKKLLANTIITYWMSGYYKTKDGLKVSNYQEMYAWKSTGYLIPNAQCRGDFGFWQNKPNVS